MVPEKVNIYPIEGLGNFKEEVGIKGHKDQNFQREGDLIIKPPTRGGGGGENGHFLEH